MRPAIEAVELTRRFPSGVAVDALSFELPAGLVLALLGPNGAGKTTTVRILNGVLKADTGEARVLGLDSWADGTEVRRRTGVLTENAGLDDRLTTRENLLFTARLRGFGAVDGLARVDEMLERFGMTDRADDLTQGFSTGQRKRVALARALLHDPDVLFLDEPTSGLDPAGTRDVIDLIQSLAGEGRTIVLATHFLGEAGRLADRMAVLHRGQLRAYGEPAVLAADLWQGMSARIDTDGPVPPPVLEELASLRGVLEVHAPSALAAPDRSVPGTNGSGPAPDRALTLRIDERIVVREVVAALVRREVGVLDVHAHAPTLEDVYFEIERRIVAETGEKMTDGFLGRSIEDWSVGRPARDGQSA